MSATLQVGANATNVSPAFYGVGVRANVPLRGDSVSLLSSTPIRYLRYPDGTIGERLDVVNGSIYTPGYRNVSRTDLSAADFVSTCQAIACGAIVQLPLEIDSPSTGAYEVAYFENTLHFHPMYWELGNEPATWDCYGTPWSNWASGCSRTTDPLTFATETAAYIRAVRAVDPAAQFVGLGGTGTGNANDRGWITPLEQLNGRNLSAISIHSYVDDHIPSPTIVTLSNFMSGLTSHYALPPTVVTARSAIHDGCANCSTQVFVTEMNAVGGEGPLTAYLGTFYSGVFFAAEMVQGLNTQVSNIDPFTWENGFITSSGRGARYVVESTFLSQLGPREFNASVNAPGVFAVVTEGNGATELMVVNGNATQNVTLSLAGSGLDTSGGALEWGWTAADSGPREFNRSGAALTAISLPATSIELFTFLRPSGGLLSSLTASPASLRVGESTLLTTTASGGTPPYTYDYSALPPGCGSANLSSVGCTPTSSGNFTILVTVTDHAGNQSVAQANISVTMLVMALTAVLSMNPGSAAANSPITITARADGGTPPYQYSYSGLPPGCTSVDAPALACIPSAPGSFAPSVTVTDSLGNSTSATGTLTVMPATVQTTGHAGPTQLHWAAAVDLGAAVMLAVGAYLVRPRRE